MIYKIFKVYCVRIWWKPFLKEENNVVVAKKLLLESEFGH